MRVAFGSFGVFWWIWPTDCSSEGSTYELKQQLAKDRRLFCERVSCEANQASPSFVIQKLRVDRCCWQTTEESPYGTCCNDWWSRTFGQIDWRAQWPVAQTLLRTWRMGFQFRKKISWPVVDDSQNQRVAPMPVWNEITLHDLERSLRQNRYGKSTIPNRRLPQVCACHWQGRFSRSSSSKRCSFVSACGVQRRCASARFQAQGLGQRVQELSCLWWCLRCLPSQHIVSWEMISCILFRVKLYPYKLGGLAWKGSWSGGPNAFGLSLLMCRQKKVSAALLFVDIRQAFYRMIRSHVVDTGTFDESVCTANSILWSCRPIPLKTSWRRWRTALQYKRAGVSPFLAAHLTESMLYTWFQLPTDSGISQTRKGSRPGDNLADILFSFSFRKILKSAMEIDLSFETIADRNPYPLSTRGQQRDTVR